MILHEDPITFDAIIQRVSERTGINVSIIEKDYYVSLALQEIGSRQDTIPAFFKGGTCLYKIYMDMKRFSEDIDLTVKVDHLSNSQAKKMLEKAAQDYNCMKRLKGDPLEENHKGSITSVFGYAPLYDVDINDQLQRYGKLKIEATSFTVSEPYETNTTSSLIYQYATEDEKQILSNKYGISTFDIRNISIERMFADKILAAEFYLQRGNFFDVSKHIYDLSVMVKTTRIQKLLTDESSFIHYLSYKREEEKLRIGSDLSEKPLKEFKLFTTNLNSISELASTFQQMQRIYVIHDNDKLTYSDTLRALEYIKNVCIQLSDRELLSVQAHNKLKSSIIEMEQIRANFFSMSKEERDACPIKWQGDSYRISAFEDLYLSKCQEAHIVPDEEIEKHFYEVCVDGCDYTPVYCKNMSIERNSNDYE
ncbi:MAG: nucleotidyl transferase AbiEii/AbiGii toxin family protein [Parasporobacterium sp.]|nr:nucleotidyl transferase AbiEii/AbiGii toxin family protein [Parasporobacterium sp.]